MRNVFELGQSRMANRLFLECILISPTITRETKASVEPLGVVLLSFMMNIQHSYRIGVMKHEGRRDVTTIGDH